MSTRRSIGAVWVGLLAAAALHLAVATAADAAVVRLINRDGPREGFNDETPVEPVGGNSGTTLGEQRLIAFQHAVDTWAAALDSAVEIRISAAFNPLDCNATVVTLGMAGPVHVFRDFAGAPLPNTYYASPLADRLAGTDLAPDEDDIEAEFNSRFGTTCTFPAGWYYGLDANPPGDDSDLVTVVLHELGHGMGFLTLLDVETGERFEDRDDVFLTHLVDDRSGQRLSEMTNAQRRNASRATGHVRWDGTTVVAASDQLDRGADESGRVSIYAPFDLSPGSSISHWDERLGPDELMEPFFTHAIHDVGLAAEALGDMGWTALPPGGCQADCTGDARVAIDELILSVRIALGELPLASCAAADSDDSGVVEVGELVGGVSSALDGCAANALTAD
jgi:hypothetical protein